MTFWSHWWSSQWLWSTLMQTSISTYFGVVFLDSEDFLERRILGTDYNTDGRSGSISLQRDGLYTILISLDANYRGTVCITFFGCQFQRDGLNTGHQQSSVEEMFCKIKNIWAVFVSPFVSLCPREFYAPTLLIRGGLKGSWGGMKFSGKLFNSLPLGPLNVKNIGGQCHCLVALQ